MDIVAAHLCQRAISPFPYLDDWLIRDLIRTRLISHTIYCPQTMQSQGFIPNLKKSDLNPAQQFTFIGMEFLTQHNTVRLQLDCMESILLTVKQFLTDSSFGLNIPFSFGETQCCSRLSTSRQVPFMSASDVPAVSLETSCSSFGSSNFDLEYDPQFHLKWWMDPNRFIQGIYIHPPDPNAFLFTDASLYGWGAHLEPMRLSFHGHWTEDQSQLHINILEIMAIPFALKKVIQCIHHSCVRHHNSSSYINKQGGTHSPSLRIEVWKILHWCLEHNVILRICHIPGKFNILADSRD